MLSNVFYADDDEDDRDIFIEVANEIATNVNVTTYENGNDLLKTLNKSPQSNVVVFLDLNMPFKNGFEVLEELKANAVTSNYPVCIFTTSTHPDQIERAKELGATLFIRKPTTYNLFKTTLIFLFSKDWRNYTPNKTEFFYENKE